MLGLGLFADALFGLIAIVNSAIGIRQELQAKETLDRLALLVAPRAKVVRDSRLVELHASEVVPGDLVRVEPGDQLVADGVVVDSRGLTVDESLLTGESDGIRKRAGDRLLSGSFVISGSGHYELDAVRDDSYAEKIAGEAKRVPPPALAAAGGGQPGPEGDLDRAGADRDRRRCSASPSTASAFARRPRPPPPGLVTLIPEGLVLLMSVTFAVAAVRLARQNTLVQQMAATEALAAVDTICVDKTGTLTDGTLKLIKVEPADPNAPRRRRAGARHLRRLGRRAQPHPGDDRRELPGPAREGQRRGPVLLGLEVERADPERLQLRDRSARRPRARPAPWRSTRVCERTLDEHTSAGRRVIAFAETQGGLPSDPGDPGAAAARAAGAGRARGDAAPRRRRDDRVHARAAGRPEADLRRRPRDGDRRRACGRGPRGRAA